jgi:anti-sigma B factor antagonist
MTTWLFEPATEERSEGEVLDITLRFVDEVTVCVLDGPLCAYTAPVLDGWLDQLEDNGRHRVIVDASDVVTMSSDGVDVLSRHAELLRTAGGALQIRAPSTVARRVLALCDADHLIEPDDWS